MEKLPVIFRAERSGPEKGDVTAVFPTLLGTYDPATFTVYAHIGQHGSADRSWYNRTRAATETEYAPLLAELRGIYETPGPGGCPAFPLVVRRRMARAHDKARREDARRLAKQP